MKFLRMILMVCCFTACKKENKKDKSIDKMIELKKDVGLPTSYTDTLSLISLISSDEFDYDKEFLKIDYKKETR